MPQQDPPRVTVVIPTLNRVELIQRALDALARQTLPPAALEVVVADDGSRDGTPEVLEARAAAGAWPFRLRVLRLAHAGPAVARNEGARAAAAPVIAFADSDVLPGPGWLEAGLAALAAEPCAGGVEGRTVIGDRERVTPFTHQTENVSGGRYPTCNLFVRRAVFEAVGGFDPAFGPRSFFREDTDLAFRILDAGHAIPFSPAAVVVHPPLPASLLTPLRLARRYRHDPRLRRKHPRRYATEADVHTIGGVRLVHPRQRLYVLNVASLVALIAALALGARPAALGAAALYALTLAGIALLHLRSVPPTPRALAAVPLLLPMLPLVPWVYVVSVVEGRLALRARPDDHHLRPER